MNGRCELYAYEKNKLAQYTCTYYYVTEGFNIGNLFRNVFFRCFQNLVLGLVLVLGTIVLVLVLVLAIQCTGYISAI